MGGMASEGDLVHAHPRPAQVLGRACRTVLAPGRGRPWEHDLVLDLGGVADEVDQVTAGPVSGRLEHVEHLHGRHAG